MKDANKNTVTDEMYPLRIQGAASRTGCADLARGKPQNCGLTLPDHADAAAIRILAHPIDGRMSAFTAECLKHRERLRRELPSEPGHVVTEQARGFARLVLDRLQRAEGR